MTATPCPPTLLRASAGELVDELDECVLNALLEPSVTSPASVTMLCARTHALAAWTDPGVELVLDPSDFDSLRADVLLDAQAHYRGDPAATSLREVLVCYPGLRALLVQRFVHPHAERAPVLARLMSESAHQRTGIDLHPRARLGKSLMIDHGTGVVVGASAWVGNDVKVYQGVTLGALSTGPGAHEARHPHIEDEVVLYANATVLGPVRVGHHSRIGAGATLTSSVAPYSRVRALHRIDVVTRDPELR